MAPVQGNNILHFGSYHNDKIISLSVTFTCFVAPNPIEQPPHGHKYPILEANTT